MNMENLEKHLLKKLELRTAVLEEGAEIQEEKWEDVVHDLKLLISHISGVNQWISSQFGVDLTSLNSKEPYKYIFAEADEDSPEERDDDDVVSVDFGQSPPATALAAPPGTYSTSDLKEESLTIDSSGGNGDRIEEEFILATNTVGPQLQASYVDSNSNQIHDRIDVEEVIAGGGSGKASQSRQQQPQPSSQVQACQVLLVDISKSIVSSNVAIMVQPPQPGPSSELQNNITAAASTAEQDAAAVQTVLRRRFICHYCPSSFGHRNQLSNHVRTHTRERPFVCSTCHQRFSQAVNLNVHMRIHTGIRPFPCSICPKSFDRRQLLDEHLNNHRNEKPFECPICNETFFSNKARSTHMQKRHDGGTGGVSHSCTSGLELTHQQQQQLGREENNHDHCCNICGINFQTSDELKTHFSTSHDGNNLEISTSTSPTPRRKNNNNDSKEKSGKNLATRFICHYCDRTFARRLNLKEHERIHTGEKPFRCSLCQQGFVRADGLKIHMRAHAGEKRYACHLCSKAFALNNSLDAHLNREHRGGVKPYECHLCEERFYSKVIRHRHISKVHQLTKTWRCKICGASFQTNHGLKVHIGQHYKRGGDTIEKEVKVEEVGTVGSNSNNEEEEEEVAILPN